MPKAKKTAPEPIEYANGHIVERPDGFYWVEKKTGTEYGPFATLREAEEDMEYGAVEEADADTTLQEAEDQIGIAGWIDPETGEPAEESIPHIEDS